MCRNIRRLFNYEPPTTAQDLEAAALQFVRTISGYQKPSKANEQIFDQAVEEIARTAGHLLEQLTTTAPRRNREEELVLARAQRAARVGQEGVGR